MRSENPTFSFNSIFNRQTKYPNSEIIKALSFVNAERAYLSIFNKQFEQKTNIFRTNIKIQQTVMRSPIIKVEICCFVIAFVLNKRNISLQISMKTLIINSMESLLKRSRV